jgi:hypothetical protein
MVGATAEKIAALPDKVNDGVAGPARENADAVASAGDL